MLVSVIMATRNCRDTVGASIDSVLLQPADWRELIVIDAASTDGTLDLLRSYGDQIAVVSEPDDGIADAWNKGLNLASGEWIVFLGSDDLLTPASLANVVSVSPTDYDIVHGLVQICGGPWDGLQVGARHSWEDFRRKMNLPHQAVYHSRQLFERVGTFNTAFKLAADYELLLRRGQDLKCHFIPELLALQGGEGLSVRLVGRVLHEHCEAQLTSGALNRTQARLNLYLRRVAHLRNELLRSISR